MRTCRAGTMKVTRMDIAGDTLSFNADDYPGDGVYLVYDSTPTSCFVPQLMVVNGGMVMTGACDNALLRWWEDGQEEGKT